MEGLSNNGLKHLKQRNKVVIPARYLLKLVVELIFLAFSLFVYSISHKWLGNFEKLGPIVLVFLRFFIFLMGASLAVRLMAIIYRQRKHLPYNRKDNVTLG